MEFDNSAPASEPMAVIGMSCKFSGGATCPDKLWDLMAAGETGWSKIPEDRYDLRGVYHSNHERTSTTHVKGGHFLDENVAAFDAAFFNYSAEMAQAVDPQFRLQLESTYEALENAGLPLSQVMGSQTSVFAGVFTHDYQEGIIRDEDRLPRFNVVGTWSPMSSNRISHFFDFRGASMTLETGCSTTLVALHQAVSTLRNREADMSVVTGANVMLNPDTFKAIGSLGMLSPDGRSFAFDSRANGYGRGEGVCTIIIKRLSDALANNDPIRAVIRETALNQDGRTDTITTPSGPAQVELMRECYRRAGLDPRGTQYFEAHGTGTPTGDPIEAGAMAAIFSEGEGRDHEDYYLRIGSVKTNVGHTEAASGLAAMIKGVLCLEKGLIPPSVNYETPNPKLKLDEWRLKVVRGLEKWPDSLVDGPCRMSINNFGYGGANAHVILESADPWTLASGLDLDPKNGNGYIHGNGHVNGNGHLNGNGRHLNGSASTHGAYAHDKTNDAKVLILSARDERGCQQMVSDFKAYLEKKKSLAQDGSEQLLRDLSYTLGERRSLFQWVAAHQVRLDENGSLEAAIQALDTPRFKPTRRAADRPRIGMIFTGQGAQWNAMGRELLILYPVFCQSIDKSEVILKDLGADWSLLEELLRDKKTTKVHATNISIPVCVALQIALVSLLKSWGITASAVASHSSGEISAAYAVGALSHRQALAAAYWRAVLVADEIKRAPGAPKGAMAAVGLGVETVQPYLNRLTRDHGKAVVACVNSPQSVTISGDDTAVQMIEDWCKKDDVFARRLKVQQAYHSHLMDPFAAEYRERLRPEMARDIEQHTKQQQASKQELSAIFSSAVTGGRIVEAKEIASPDHWVGSLVGAVEFVDAFTEMVLGNPDDADGRSVDVLLEVGPHTALGGPIREILSLPEFEGLDLPYWGCLVRDEHAGDSMRSAALGLFREGHPLVMDQINFPVPAYDDESPQVLTDLPSYPWNHTMRHWQESRVNKAINERSQPPHELLGMRVAGNDPRATTWRRILRVSETPWVRDHMVQGSIVYPGSGYICHAIEAAKQLAKEDNPDKDISGFRLRDVNFLFACVVPDGAEGADIRTTLQYVSEREVGARGWYNFEVSSVTLDDRWTLHAKGMVMAERQVANTENIKRQPLSRYTRQPDPQDLFANLRARSVHHGPLFRNTTRIIQDGRKPRSLCDVTIRHEVSSDTDALVAASNTVLHPITLDAVVVAFYSALPSVGALQDDPKLPHSVSSLWISNQISNEVGRTLCCDTSLLHDDAKTGKANITVFDGDTDLAVLDIQGVEFASLGRGSGASARQDPAKTGGAAFTPKWEQEVVSKLVWGPDLSLRNPLAFEQIKTELADIESCGLGESGSTQIKQLSLLVRKVAHKNPNARVLWIGNGNETLAVRSLLQTLDQPLLGSWHITEPTSEALEDVRAQLSEWAAVLEFGQLNIEESPAKQTLTTGSYDIVVSIQAICSATNTTNVLTNVRNLLKSSGTLLFTETANETSSWDDLLRKAGFAGIDLEIRGSELDHTVSRSVMMCTLPLAEIKQSTLSNHENFAVVTSTAARPPSGFVQLVSLQRLSERIKALTGTDVEHLSIESSSFDLYKGKTCIFVGEIEMPIMADLDPMTMEGLRAMVTQCEALLWVTTGGTVDSEMPERALHQGFLRVMRNEYISRRFLSLDLDPAYAAERWLSSDETNVSTIIQVMEEAFGNVDTHNGLPEFEYAERGGVLQVPRYYKDEQYNDMIAGSLVPRWGELLPQGANDDKAGSDPLENLPLESLFQDNKPLRLEVGIPGHSDTLAFVHEAIAHDEGKLLRSDQIEIAPRAFGVSSRDVLAATGEISDPSMGQELAGFITHVGVEAQAKGFNVGDRVMALSTSTSFASYARLPWHDVIKIPSSLDFASAASIPRAFATAYVALVDIARLEAGQSVLVHAASGAIGQAAIMLAKHVGLTEVYATVGSPESRELLRREHGIPDEHIFDSRDASFAPAVMAATKGRGVDVLLNSIPGGLLRASISTIAPLGHLIELGGEDIRNNSLMALGSFSRGVSFVSLDISTLLRRGGHRISRALHEIAHLIEQKAIRPAQPIHSYPLQDVQSAFRFVQMGEQMGKTVLSAGPDEQVHVVPQPRGVTTRAQLRADASYLVVGGVGGIGRSVVQWLVTHGATNLILLSRSAADLDLDKNKNTDGALFLRELRDMGCRIKSVSCDIGLPSSLTKAISACEADGLPPVRGVIQAAMLLRDAIFEQMTFEDWTSGLSPKLYGTWNLHTEFSQPGSLDFFVMLSSVSGVVGIASQSNYAAGGSYEDAMARWRQSHGLPGVAIDFGPISDIGYVSTSPKVAERLRKEGDFAMLDEDIVLRSLNAAITHPLNSRPQIIVGLNSSPGPQWDPSGRSQLGRDARFTSLRPITKTSSSAKDDSSRASLSTLLSSAADVQAGAELVGTTIATKLANIFMMPVGEIDLSKSPAHFGVDSLIAVELRNMLVLQAAADISIFNILQTSSLGALAALVAEKSRLIQSS